MQYRSAIRFDEPWESLWERCTLDGYQMPADSGRLEMLDGHLLPDVPGAVSP